MRFTIALIATLLSVACNATRDPLEGVYGGKIGSMITDTGRAQVSKDVAEPKLSDLLNDTHHVLVKKSGTSGHYRVTEYHSSRGVKSAIYKLAAGKLLPVDAHPFSYDVAPGELTANRPADKSTWYHMPKLTEQAAASYRSVIERARDDRAQGERAQGREATKKGNPAEAK